MHNATPTATRLSFNRFVQSFANVGPTVIVLAVLAAGWLAVHEMNLSDDKVDDVEISQTAPDMLKLPAGKLAAGNFAFVAAETRRLQPVHTVPGRIEYDDSKHIDVRSPVDGILDQVLVTPGDCVTEGQLLAVLRSPEIGQSRAEILKQKKGLEIAKELLEREITISKNLEKLSTLLYQNKLAKEIETAFATDALGTYRENILSAYARMQLASELLANVQPLADSGAVAGRAIREREAERQVAQTTFRAARDQAIYDAGKAKLKASADVAEAERQYNLAWQSLDALLGFQQERTSLSLDSQAALSHLEVRAPFAGTIEARGFASNERVNRSDILITLANTSSLYVAASIREGDWSAVSLEKGTRLRVTVPALNDRVFDASVYFVGREVNKDTNSISVVATIDNAEGLLRPGMFIRVTIPAGEARQTLAVKPESVVQHENKKFVFVALKDGAFQRVDVSTGQHSQDWVEVTSGLTPGQRVVTTGAFLLKSEILLQGEVE